MKIRTQQSDLTREYRQVARAEASAEREQKIVAVFKELLRTRWLDEFTLNDVADGAGVTAQTVIRKFGGKEGLLKASLAGLSDEVSLRRAAPEGDIDGLITALVADYDAAGDMVMRLLNVEDREPIVRPFADYGRKHHRGWVAAAFKRWLAPLPPRARAARLDLLVAATDLYLWRLFRRDMGHDAATTASLMKALVLNVIGTEQMSEGKGP